MKYGELKISGCSPLIFSKGLGVPTDEITRLCIQTTWKPTGQPPYRFAIAHETKVHTLKRRIKLLAIFTKVPVEIEKYSKNNYLCSPINGGYSSGG
jgi:hypothetical protein